MSLQAHFRKAAAFHSKASSLHEKIAQCHQDMHDGEGAKAASLHGLAKSAGRDSLEHFETEGLMKSSGKHKALSEHHAALAKLHQTHSEHLREMAGLERAEDALEPTASEVERVVAKALGSLGDLDKSDIDPTLSHLVGPRGVEAPSLIPRPPAAVNKADVDPEFRHLLTPRGAS